MLSSSPTFFSLCFAQIVGSTSYRKHESHLHPFMGRLESESRTKNKSPGESRSKKKKKFMHCYDFYQIKLYVFNKFSYILYKLQSLLRFLQWKLGRDQKYSLSGGCKRNFNYGTCIKYSDLEQCQSRFSLSKFLINVSTFLIFYVYWIK